MDTYDPRYLAGILFFNEHDFFEAHEVWEDLWSESHGDERRFVQGLIQAAVGLFHFSGGNLGGAMKLYRSSYDYMKTCGSPFLGLDVTAFWLQMGRCFEPLLSTPTPNRSLRLTPELVPVITLDPPPTTWPDPAAYTHEEE
ncbi:MAG TPA: DUF309 domain-containing protein [Gemmataceae bacterium]|nr:DUF309 domain-containing protein [Gemmataceae bacterium]